MFIPRFKDPRNVCARELRTAVVVKRLDNVLSVILDQELYDPETFRNELGMQEEGNLFIDMTTGKKTRTFRVGNELFMLIS